MNSETVDLIATDPPFNKGRDFHATPDSLAAGAKFQDRWSWAADVEGEWIDQIRDDWPAVWDVIASARASWGDDMGAFLCFMGVRLIAMHRVLKPTGSLYLHCDPTASHYLKALLDAIFGRRSFRNEVIWCYRGMPAKAAKWQAKHDTILFYAKTDAATFHVLKGEPTEGSRRTFASAMRRGYNANHAKKMVTVFDWEKYRQAVADGDIPADLGPVPFTGGRPPMRDWWEDIKILGGPGNKERMGYPTQKPLALYERILQASSNSGDVVLDPFAGCATTLVAAERLERQWVGIDIWDGAAAIVQQRMADARQLLTDIPTIHHESTPPQRTDSGEAAAPFLQMTERYAEPEGPRMSRAAMHEHLIAQHGCRCQGCDRVFDDPRYLELDHNTPRSDGGLNHITNRVLLCGPCNRVKSNTYTLSGLRRENAKRGYMGGKRS